MYILEDIDTLIKNKSLNFEEVGSSIMGNILLVSYMKGESVKSIDVTVAEKVRAGIMSLLIEGYFLLAENLGKLDKTHEAKYAYENAVHLSKRADRMIKNFEKKR